MNLNSTNKKHKDAFSYYKATVTKGDKFYTHLPDGSASDLVLSNANLGGQPVQPILTFVPRECLNHIPICSTRRGQTMCWEGNALNSNASNAVKHSAFSSSNEKKELKVYWGEL